MRIWTLGISILVHFIALVLLVAVPLFATGVLPVPQQVTIFIGRVSDIPALPPPATIRRTPQARPRSSEAAPIREPDAVMPDAHVEPIAAPSSNETTTVEIGDPGAIDWAVTKPEPPPVEAPEKSSVRPGGLILPPRKIRDVAPIYPQIARESRTQGIVILEALIAEDGVVQEVRVLRSVRLLDDAAIQAVRQWRFTPTLLNGQAVPIVMTVTVAFSLR